MPIRKLVLTRAFERSYKKFAKGNSVLEENIAATLRLMEIDVFTPILKSHKLSGKLHGLYTCSCGYDCRIIFSIEIKAGKELILLIDIGTHDDVY